MKIGPHSGMTLEDIVESKKAEEKVHGVHYWGYSGVFCQPRKTQEFCRWARKTYREEPSIIFIETKSAYHSSIGCIRQFSADNETYTPFRAPVQLQGAQFAFVAENLRVLESFHLTDYRVYGGKNDGKLLTEHLRFRVNKSFAVRNSGEQTDANCLINKTVLFATLVEPYAVWLSE